MQFRRGARRLVVGSRGSSGLIMDLMLFRSRAPAAEPEAALRVAGHPLMVGLRNLSRLDVTGRGRKFVPRERGESGKESIEITT